MALKYYLDTFDAFMDGGDSSEVKRWIMCTGVKQKAIGKAVAILNRSKGGSVLLLREIKGRWGNIGHDFGDAIGYIIKTPESIYPFYEGDISDEPT